MYRTIIILIFIVWIPTHFLFSQDIEWLRCYGGSERENAFTMSITDDAGFIVAGSAMSNDGDVSNNYGQSDCWILKLDADGEIIWERNYGGTGTETAYAIKSTSDGGYLFAGATNSINGDVQGQHGYYDVWVVKTDSVGNIIWQNCLGGGNRESAYAAAECHDGGYILAGYTLSDDGDISVHLGEEDAWVVKLDSTGNLEWEKTFGSDIREYANTIMQTPDNGFIMGGAQRIINSSTLWDDAWIVKMNSTGNLEWERTYGGVEAERIYSIVQTDDDGYVFAASTASNDGGVTGNHGSADFWIVKIDNSGELIWQKCFGGSDSDVPNHIMRTDDHGFIICGNTRSDDGDVNGYSGAGDAWVIKIDSVANLEWQNCIGSDEDDRSKRSFVLNNNIHIIGFTKSNNGIFYDNHGDYDVWVSKLSETVGIKNNLNHFSFELYPNPSTGNYIKVFCNTDLENLQVSCFNISGQEICHQKIFYPESFINVSAWQSGIYLVVLHQGERILDVMKLVVK